MLLQYDRIKSDQQCVLEATSLQLATNITHVLYFEDASLYNTANIIYF